ncbi:hypothetical protein SARC_02202 [Sphaeroforma arctica JP610]|uniref:Brix domain-containing protein n=1 Tax=Sphaeroforma arctica JP610 TaxID=667725 RepID=A0A0L0G9Q2_9EUKA|nr:hypothetical protein SARC_02202 [Sphaeroforma arctica JP610]KNC85629.1 hypothetical protein SARC_02202 [Sphaeroforma arctica JP610]|eukprot:XP_014159531.1 hypothetical protein SARC_02202 [Sphaeroforma arctica JP610]
MASPTNEASAPPAVSKPSKSGPVASWSNQVINNPSGIKCKDKRKQIYAKYKKAKKENKKRRREETKKAEEDIPEDERPVKVQKTIENMRVADETIVEADDEEVINDAETDELSAYFKGQQPKIMVTTSRKAIGAGTTYKFAEELINLMPDAEFIQRRNYDIKEITQV